MMKSISDSSDNVSVLGDWFEVDKGECIREFCGGVGVCVFLGGVCVWLREPGEEGVPGRCSSACSSVCVVRTGGAGEVARRP